MRKLVDRQHGSWLQSPVRGQLECFVLAKMHALLEGLLTAEGGIAWSSAIERGVSKFGPLRKQRHAPHLKKVFEFLRFSLFSHTQQHLLFVREVAFLCVSITCKVVIILGVCKIYSTSVVELFFATCKCHICGRQEVSDIFNTYLTPIPELNFTLLKYEICGPTDLLNVVDGWSRRKCDYSLKGAVISSFSKRWTKCGGWDPA